MKRCLTGLLAYALLLITTPAQAHTLSVAHVDIIVPTAGTELDVELDLALRDLALTLPLDGNGDEEVTWGELVAIRDPLFAMVAKDMQLSADGGRCQLSPKGLATRQYDDGAYATLQFKAHCPSRTRLRLHYSLLFDRDPQHRALVTLRRGDATSTAIAKIDATDLDLRSDTASPFFAFLREGARHILIGYDHLAFLISLLLPAALLRVGRQWQPSTNLRASGLQVLGIVTAFTLAHSVTLSLAALGWVTPASRWVEAAIAASVLLAALNNIHPLVRKRLWLVGFGFGLIHGFGFAGALGELGLPDNARLLALLGFNLGVELGQMVVVCLLLPLLFAVRRQRWYAASALPILSLMIAGLGGYWLYVRLAG